MAAGTVVQLASTDSQHSGLDASRVEITVNGNLDIEGTASAPVQFLGEASTTPGLWYGIVINSGATSAIIKHADVASAYYGIYNNESSVLNASNISVHDGEFGFYLAGGPSTLDAVTIEDSLDAGIYVAEANGTISNALIEENGGDGVYAELDSGSELLIIQATIYGNAGSGVAGGPASVLTVQNSIITNNRFGVSCDNGQGGCRFLTVSYNDVVDNSTADYVGVSAGTGSISQTPNYVDAPNNLELAYPSPGIDEGLSTNAPDHDLNGQMRPLNATGTPVAQYDMGAYEAIDRIFASGFE